MRERKLRRRRIVTANGYRFSVCGFALRPSPTLESAIDRRYGNGFAWLSSATLLIVVLFSVYAVERPPSLPDGSRAYGSMAAFERYSLSDVLAAVSR